MKSAQIGAAGVLLLQYKLLKCGIDSSVMTTDDGVDVVAYSPALQEAITIQVKTVLAPKKSGGKGKLALDWWLRHNSPAQLVALCDLSTDSTWILRHEEYLVAAQQHSSGRAHLYFYRDISALAPENSKEPFFDKFQLDRRIHDLFGVPKQES